MDGEWYAYLEEFHLRGFSTHAFGAPLDGEEPFPPDNGATLLRVCLPDLIKPSKDFKMTANGIKTDDTLGVVPQTIVPKTAQHDVIPAVVSYYKDGEDYYNDQNPGPPTNVAKGGII
eukprot:SAG31_NODE_13_length_37961_cov_21.751307_34_plen_117_part_00